MIQRLQETEADRQAMFRRRAVLLAGVQGAAFGALGLRLYQLSISEGEKYHTLAEDNRLSLRFIAPIRGRILDRFGQEMAGNTRNFSVVVVPEQVDSLDATLEELTPLLGLTPSQIERIRKRARRQRGFVPIVVKDHLDWEVFAKLNMQATHLPGVQPTAGTARVYPNGQDAAHVLGYVGAVAQKDMSDDPVLTLPGFKIGKEGIERQFETALRGTTGNRRVEVNARGRVIREVERDDAQQGDDLKLTLDSRLQQYAAQRMGEESAGIVVMDVRTGDILALVSTPAYNPNDFVDGISQTNWNGLLNDPRRPLVNKALAGQYPPGSTFKMLVTLAALEAGVITPETTHFCNGRHKVGNQLFHCWKKHGHGKVDLTQALGQSCDVYFYKIANDVGIDRIAETARRFGLGQTYGLPIPGEKRGLVPTPDWKRLARDASWVGGDTVNVSIGQGALLATPIQLAVMTSRLVNGGRPILPRLVASDAQADVSLESLAKPDHLEIVKRGMWEVVNGKKGTARAAALPEELGEMAGKTGTAQVRRISAEEREAGVLKNEDIAWKQRDHALFVGYAPADVPRYAVSVLVQHGGGGSTVAAPVASDILAEALRLDPVPTPLRAASRTEETG